MQGVSFFVSHYVGVSFFSMVRPVGVDLACFGSLLFQKRARVSLGFYFGRVGVGLFVVGREVSLLSRLGDLVFGLKSIVGGGAIDVGDGGRRRSVGLGECY